MTTLLKQAIREAEQLPAEDQDAIAARWLAEIEDERAWDERFRGTTAEQWDKVAAEARQDVAARQTLLLDEVFPAGESAQ